LVLYDDDRLTKTLPELYGDIHDPETGGSYTVKRYKSEKEGDGTGSWQHTEIRLLAENLEFDPLILKDAREDELHVVAELVEVLKG
jgi:hypothetical protein